MKILAWSFLTGLGLALFFQVCPPSLAWFRAWAQEPEYAAWDLLDARVAGILAAMALTYAALLFLCRRVLRHTRIAPGRGLAFAACENGALIFEFALVFPFILSLIFILFQWAEILMVDGIVHYAAFCAARTASTWASEANGTRFTIANNDPKYQRMLQSAAMALYPAIALEGAAQRRDPGLELLDFTESKTVPAQNLREKQSHELKKYRHVGVKVNWSLRPRWPVVGLFFKPILENGRIPMSRGYRMEIEPYVISNNRFPFDMVFREEKARQALHDKVFPGNHHTGLTWYHAETVTKRKKGDMSECTWIGLGGREPCCPSGKLGQFGQLLTPFGGGIKVPPQ